MARHICFLMLLFSCANFAIAQKDYREGFILNSSNDTIRGFINYRENRSNFQVCEFKKDLSESTATSYHPGQISVYGFKGERVYLSRGIQFPDSTRKRVFLEVLVKGRITLFKLREKGFYDLFYIEKGNDFYLVNNGKPRRRDESRKQLGILNYVMYDCPAIKSKMANVEPDEQSIVQITEEYNTCMGGESVTYKATKKWIAFTPQLSAGIAFSSMKAEAKGAEPYEGKYESHLGATFGFGVDISLPRTRERWALHLESVVMPAEYALTAYTYTTISENKFDYNLKSTQLKFPIGFKYIFPGSKFKPFFNGGVSLTTNLNSSSTAIRTTVYSNIPFSPIKVKAPNIDGDFSGGWTGMGGIMPIRRNFAVYAELRYEFTDGLVFTEGVASSKIHNVYAVVGVRF